MRNLCLSWNGPVSLRPATIVEPASLNHSLLVKSSLALMVLLFVSAAAPKAQAQEQTWGDSSTPLIYSAENTGASFPAPSFPSFAQLPIIRPLPDPFVFANGTRDTSFPNWERRRNEMLAAVEKYEIGPKPDCHDCTITANYTPPVSGSSTGSLTVNVTRNGKTLTLTSGVYIPQGMGSGPFPAVIAMEIKLCFSFGGSTFCFGPRTARLWESSSQHLFRPAHCNGWLRKHSGNRIQFFFAE